MKRLSLTEATCLALEGKLDEARSHPLTKVGDTDMRSYR